ncbi:hypothetical protein DFP93_10539 [Aneurinibacillus soli]|uniref:Uncharacterized protein n=1 Tax=Aneurinibacillus soli TaxID=1500254 RepID=A0A0U5AY89_9BACL|nr:hypothetical protein DFP93_10539 [Aneurinibacillus soli]BAU28725.1 hypothetical protein CB4_02900 [Aneurinibacillus soli]
MAAATRHLRGTTLRKMDGRSGDERKVDVWLSSRQYDEL